MTGFRWTIKRKLLALGAGTLLPLLLLLAFWAWWEAHERTEAAEAELTLASAQAASLVEHLLDRLMADLSVRARHPAIQRREAEQMAEVLRRVRAAYPEIENVIVVGADGRVIATADPEPAAAPVSLVDRPWFQRLMAAGRPTVSGFLIGRITGQPIAVVAVPLSGDEGSPTGALAVGLSLNRLYALFHLLPLTGGRTVTVVDAESHVLSQAPKAQRRIGERLPSAAALPAGPAGVKRLPWFDEGERVAGVSPVGGTGWLVLVSIPRSALQDQIWREVRAIAFPLLGLLAISGLIGLLIARRVWEPLPALAEAAAHLPHGAPVPVPANATDEVGDLVRAFNTMAAQVSESRQKLEAQVAELATTNEAGRLLTSTLELSEVLSRLTELARVRLEADVVRIWLAERGSEDLVLKAQAGVTKDASEYRARLLSSEGLVSWIMEHRAPLIIPDLQSDPRAVNRDWFKAEGLVSLMGVPLVLDDVAVGALVVMSRRPREFGPEDVKVAEAIALPAAVALRNASLYDKIREQAATLDARTAHLQLLHLTARAMVAERDLDRLLPRLVESARELLNARYAALVVFGDEGRVRQFFTAGITPEERERIGAPPVGRGLLGHVFKTGQALRLDDLTTHPDHAGFPPGHPPMRSLLAVPIRLREQTLGAVYLTEKPAGFTAGDEALLATLAADAAVAIENARLVKNLQHALDDLKATQEQLVRGEVLRALGEMAAGAAHHLNNLLAVILGRIQLMIGTTQDPKARHSLETIEKAGLDAAHVVRRVQEFSRAQPVPGVAPVDLNRVAEDSLELTRPVWEEQAKLRSISIDVRLEAGEVPAVTGEDASLHEVLVNLLLNAVAALPEGGKIAIKTWVSGHGVSCSVADTGVGMSEEVRRRALEPFFTTKGPKSTGLGLAVSHAIIQRHGGELEIESAEGRGTIVTVRLPVAREKAAATPAPGTPPPASPRKVLVIDDEPEVREVLTDMLARQGHRVSQAASGAEGLSMFQAGRYDLVFTDLGMAGLTGWQVAEAIKTLSSVTPVVLVTGWGDDVTRPGRDAGFVDQIMSKPFDFNTVATVIAKATMGRTA